MYEVDKILSKRYVRKKVEYLVAWKGFPESEQSWEGLKELCYCKSSITAFEQSYFPPPCAKVGGEVCKCGDTGCDGPPVPKYHPSTSSSDAKAPNSVVSSCPDSGMMASEAKQSKLKPSEAKQSNDLCTTHSVPRDVASVGVASVGVESVGVASVVGVSVASVVSCFVPPPLPLPCVFALGNESHIEAKVVESQVAPAEHKLDTPAAKVPDTSKKKPRPKPKHTVHVPGEKKCQPPVESALGKKLVASLPVPIAPSVAKPVPETKAPTEAKSSVSESNQVHRSLSVSLMDICKLDTPLVKRIPNSQRSAFATAWGRLLDEAVHNGQLSSWTDFFMYPKCILWTPIRGGSRLSKKRSMADLVKARIAKWKSDPDSLWKDVVARSKKLAVSAETPRTTLAWKLL